ncbi:hypothetical protein HmCmsJML020_00189 [Escherichia coli]|nr:hypothetical protein HmCmsJML020_00189 [Escherichia coli]
MPTQEAKAHHVGEGASMRNTSPEITEAIFSVTGSYTKIGEYSYKKKKDKKLEKK